jgi:hypothetical protein
MARSVDEINYAEMVNVGNTRPVPNLELTVEIKFTKDNGEKVVSTRTPNFPNYVMARMPANIFREYVIQMMLECVRKQVGVEPWPMGSEATTITGAAVPDPIAEE